MARSKPEVNRVHQARYKQRMKLKAVGGLVQVTKPWDYLCSAEVKEMAWAAYRVASWQVREDMFSPDAPEWTHQQLREHFAGQLADLFRDALMAHAVQEGGCWPVEAHTPPYANYPRVWHALSADVPANWYPQYPLWRQVSPASAANAPGDVITADEGNRNERDSRR